VVPRTFRPYDDVFFFLEEDMQEIILFLLTYLFVLILYELFIVRRAKSKKKTKKDPIEVTYLVRKYHLDMKKVNYNQLLQIIALTSSFDIALIVSIIVLLKNFILEILVGFIATLVIIMLSYHLVYLFYKKKGMIKNES
jgi:membrane-associated HD superfamily phosphohydrolase